MSNVYKVEIEFKDGKPILRKSNTSTRLMSFQIPEGYYLVEQYYPVKRTEKVEFSKYIFDQTITAP